MANHLLGQADRCRSTGPYEFLVERGIPAIRFLALTAGTIAVSVQSSLLSRLVLAAG